MGGCFLRFVLFALLTVGAGQASADEALTLPSIPLDKTAHYEFQFRLRHRQNVMLSFWIHPWDGMSQRDSLTHLQTVIEVSITDHAGRIVCEAAGLIHDDGSIMRDRGMWILDGSAESASLVNWNCSDIKLRRSELYALSIRIRDAGPSQTKVTLTPRLVSSEIGP
ncbi:MAG: hypothetical protein WBE13_11690 [Candidatus Acidiferrum sp.]